MSPSHPNAARDAALARMAEILDRAAALEHVSPTEFRAELAEAMAQTHDAHGERLPADLPVEEIVLSAVMELF